MDLSPVRQVCLTAILVLFRLAGPIILYAATGPVWRTQARLNLIKIQEVRQA
jgi:hypothetical protein